MTISTIYSCPTAGGLRPPRCPAGGGGQPLGLGAAAGLRPLRAAAAQIHPPLPGAGPLELTKNLREVSQCREKALHN